MVSRTGNGKVRGGRYRKELVPIWNSFLSDGKESGYMQPDLDADVFMTYLDILRADWAERV